MAARGLLARRMKLLLVLGCFLWTLVIIHLTMILFRMEKPIEAEQDGKGKKIQLQTVSHSTPNISNLEQQLKLLFKILTGETEKGRLRDEILSKLQSYKSHLQQETQLLSSLHSFFNEEGLNEQQKDALPSSQRDKCPLPSMDGFPFCTNKIDWMKEMWTTHPCYGENGVNGSFCSFVMYLSEVENWCPLLPGRHKKILQYPFKPVSPAHIQPSLEGLFEALSKKEELAWVLQRVRSMRKVWLRAGRSLENRQNITGRGKKEILLHMGLVTAESGFQMAQSAFTGGPLGELVQWADLLSSLHVLGHSLHLSVSTEDLNRVFGKGDCPSAPNNLDLIYTDIEGLHQLKKYLGEDWLKYRCIVRVLDSFGTEPEFNHETYSKANNLTTHWGELNLNPKQFYTMFPHTPDNSFLGFVVEHALNFEETQTLKSVTKKNQALVYGKKAEFWTGKETYLELIHNHTEVCGTVYGNVPHPSSSPIIPAYVKNYGLISGVEVQKVLRESKVFVGLAFPYEGPAPLEAMANGCAFLNPRFQTPHSRWNTDFFKDKPTSRGLTSQHPYAEAIGKPYVWTVDVENITEVEQALISILNQTLEPYLPYEFTCEGMLQRVNAFIENQNLCESPVTWPPLSALRVVQAAPHTSCTRACQTAGLVCEPSYFPHLSNTEALASYEISCVWQSAEVSLVAPAYDPSIRHCVFTTEPLLFSCAANHTSLTRVCPCRDFIKDQVALCQNCL